MRKRLFAFAIVLLISILLLDSCAVVKGLALQTGAEYTDTEIVNDIREAFDEDYGLGEQVKIKSFDSVLLDASVYRCEDAVGGRDIFVKPSEIERIGNLLDPDVPYKTLFEEEAAHTRSMECNYENYVTEVFNFCESFMN